MSGPATAPAGARRLTQVGVMAAASLVAMLTIRFPIVPGATFLKYDPSDAVGLLAGRTMGPGAGVSTVLLKDVLFWLLRGTDPFGPLADFLAAATFVGVASAVAHRLWPTDDGETTVRRPALRPLHAGALPAMALGVAVGTAARVVVMALANFPILYLEMGMPPARVAALMWPAIVPFNALKGLLNGALAMVLAAALVRRHAVVAPHRSS
ncbi:MAG: ECF transporter S component [Firmicutes bacterium]|nr:ECF transporter S component [Bacillota bacterium]